MQSYDTMLSLSVPLNMISQCSPLTLNLVSTLVCDDVVVAADDGESGLELVSESIACVLLYCEPFHRLLNDATMSR